MSGIAFRALTLNESLQALFANAQSAAVVDVSALVGVDTSDTGSLRSLLLQLEALPLGAGTRGEDAARARVYEAAAWVHGWATFGRLAVLSAPLKDAALRQRLLGLGSTSTSVLALLLRLFARMHEASLSDEPLLERLGNEDQNVLLLSPAYRMTWHGTAPQGVTSPWYVPASGELVGRSDDAPEINLGHLSVWALVNLQLDTWRDRAYFSTGQLEGSAPSGELASWLGHLADEPAVLAGFELETRQLGRELGVRVRKIKAYLDFRRSFAAPTSSFAILEEIARARVALQPCPDSLLGLREAAKPLVTSGEYLVDAAIWLRWVMLLAYHEDGASVVRDQDGDASPESLAATWERWGFPGQVFLPLRTLRAHSAQLRWNSAPPVGHATRLVHDLFDTTLGALALEWVIINREPTRFGMTERGIPPGALLQQRLARAQELEAALLGYVNQVSGRTIFEEAPGSRRFLESATAREQAELIASLKLLLQSVSGRLRTSALLIAAQGALTGPAGTAAWGIALGGGDATLSALNATLQSLPQLHFKAYEDELGNSIAALASGENRTSEASRLLAEFLTARGEYDIALQRLLSVRLGSRIAELWQSTVEKRARIAELDDDISALGERLAAVTQVVAQNNAAARDAQLALATRYASLASAKLEALRELGPQFEGVVEQARTQLQALGERALAMADQIEAQRQRSFVIGLVKSLVMIVGAALAPFTGGLSAPIAALVNSGIDMAVTISEINWNDLGGALGQLASVGQALASGVVLGLNTFGVEPPKALLGVRRFLSDPGAAIGGAPARVLEALRALPRADLTRMASAIASGFPLAIDRSSGQVRLGGLQEAFDVRGISADLESTLGRIFASGGFVRAEVARVGEVLSRALDTSAPELRAVLSREARAMFAAFDDGTLRVSFDQPLSTLKTGFQREVAVLGALIEDASRLPDHTVRALACVLAKGALIVERAPGSVAIVPREVTESARSAAALAARIRSYKEQVTNTEFKGFIREIEGVRQQVEDDMQAALRAPETQRDSALRNFAGTTLPPRLEHLQQALAALQVKVEEATNALEDREDERTISGFDAAAAEAASAHAKLESESAILVRSRARLGIDISELETQSSLLGIDQAGHVLAAEETAVRLRAEQLRNAYLACVAKGLSPLSRVDQGGGNAGVGLARVLSSDRRKREGQGTTFAPAESRKAARAALGMLSWLSFLDLPKGQADSRVEWYRTVLEFAHVANDSADDWTRILKGLASAMDQRDASDVYYDLVEGNWCELSASCFRWWEDMGEAEKETWLERFSERGAAVAREAYPLCVCRSVFYGPDEAPDLSLFAYEHRMLPNQLRLYVHTPGIFAEYDEHAGAGVIPPVSTLMYLAAPPSHPRASPLAPSGTPWDRATKQVPIGGPNGAVDIAARAQLRGALNEAVFPAIPERPGLLGALGEWTGLLLSNRHLTTSERAALRTRVRLRLNYFVVAPLR